MKITIMKLAKFKLAALVIFFTSYSALVAGQDQPDQADYEKGKAIYDQKNYPEALKWFQKAAGSGNADAQYYLGWMYQSGKVSGNNDYDEAMKWYRKAADQGSGDAMVGIATMYEHGEGIKKDHAEYLKWLKKAAMQGNEDAILALQLIKSNEEIQQELAELKKRENEPTKVDESAGGLEYVLTH